MNIQSRIGDNRLVYLTQTGSKLFGTDSELSDTDYQGIYLPSFKSMVLRNVEKTIDLSTSTKEVRNTKDDSDINLMSIFQFIDLMKKGDTAAIDLGFSVFRQETIVEQDKDFVEALKLWFPKMLSKNSKSFIGYCLNQAARYGVKGDNLRDILALQDALLKFEERLMTLDNGGMLIMSIRFSEFVNSEEFTSIAEAHPQFKVIKIEEASYLTVLGKNLQLTAPFIKYSDVIKKIVNSYGKRTEIAMESGGIDWKALSHAVRVVDQLNELLETGFIHFPLKNAEYIKKVKYAEIPYEDVQQYFTDKIALSNELVKLSALPEQIDPEIFDNFILDVFKQDLK